MRRSQPFELKVYLPTDPAAQQELTKRVAQIHARYVLGTISKLDCPKEQKLALLDSIIEAAKKRHKDECNI